MRLIIIIIAAIIIYTLGWAIYGGVFASVEMEEKVFGGQFLVYESYTGNYGKIHKIIDNLYTKLATEEQIFAQSGFGIYYDDPKEVIQSELKSEAGCILTENDYQKLGKIDDKYSLKKYPVQNCLVATFPFKNTLSISLGITKVYPKIERYIQTQGYKKQPIFEIYDQRNNTITYVMPIEK